LESLERIVGSTPLAHPAAISSQKTTPSSCITGQEQPSVEVGDFHTLEVPMRLSRILIALAVLAIPRGVPAQQQSIPIVGRWNLRVLNPRDVFTMWLEVERSGFRALVGRFVGLIGGARPISSVEWTDGVARFTIPSEWDTSGDLRFEIRVQGDSLVGSASGPAGLLWNFVGKRAAILRRPIPRAWTTPKPLFNGKDFTGWVPAPTKRSLPNFWIVKDGALVNNGVEGTNLMTVENFQDMKVHAEFRIPSGSSSGIFPRGRYWVILKPGGDSVPFQGTTGAVHKFLPSMNAARDANVWHSIDITLVGRRIWVVVNGRPVITDQIIPGTTGSAIDGNESAPGPIMLQGEEQRVEFRNITVSVPRS
jgi:hypothetical protein